MKMLTDGLCMTDGRLICILLAHPLALGSGELKTRAPCTSLTDYCMVLLHDWGYLKFAIAEINSK